MDTRIPVWLDCDPGHDDATAIMLAGHSPYLRLLGVSTIGGNQTLVKVTKNALDVLDACGLDNIEVVAGQARPLLRPPKLCPEIHGDSGLDGPSGGRLLPRSTRLPLQGGAKAAVVMGERIKEAWKEGAGAGREGEEEECGGAGGGRQPVRLVCTGALTNAALMLSLYPELVEQGAVEVVLMGGCMGVGNTGPVMEFNIQTDPEAAKLVFESGVKLTMVPLEVTHTVLATPEVLQAIGGNQHHGDKQQEQQQDGQPQSRQQQCTTTASAPEDGPGPGGNPCCSSSIQPPSPFRHAVQQLLLFFAATYRRVFKFEHPPLHDPVAVAYVIAPQLFEVQPMRVDVECCSPLSAGQTVCDVWGQSGLPPNCHVALRVDVGGFWELLLDAIGRADKVSPLNRSQ